MERTGSQRSSGTEGHSRSKSQGGVAVVDIWTFRVEPALEGTDLTGFSIEATDGGIGKVDEATYEAGGSYLIIDTGPWILGRKVMLPAGVVERVDRDEETVYVDRTKEEIKGSPEYDPDAGPHDRSYRDRLGRHYGSGERSDTR
jgi:hypothetical protein